MVHTHTLVFFERRGTTASFVFWQGSHFRMMFFSIYVPFAFISIFLLAQILMRTDLGDEPDSPRRLRANSTRGGHHKDAANLTHGLRGQITSLQPNLQGDSRTADTANMYVRLSQNPESVEHRQWNR